MLNLGDSIELAYGKGLTSSNRRAGKFMVFGSNGIVDTHNKAMVVGPGIIIGRKGSVGAITWSKDDFWPIDTTYYVRLKKDGDLKYWYYYLKTLHLEKMNSHAAVPGLNREMAYSIKVKSTDLPTQKKIANILSAYDDAIENNLRRISNLEEQAKIIYDKYFSVTEAADWPLTKVEKLIMRINTGDLYAQKSAKAKGVVPILDQGRSGIIGFHDSEPGVRSDSSNPVIVFANHTCYQKIIFHNFSVIQNVLPFISISERSVYWLHHCTKDIIVMNDYKGHWPEFMSKQVSVPPISLTNKFGRKVEPIYWLIYKLQLVNQNLSSARDLLLPKLMNGELKI